MTAATHQCAYVLRVGDRWMSVSMCCYGKTVPAPKPAGGAS